MLKSARDLVEKVGRQINLSKDDIDYLLAVDKEHIFDLSLKDGRKFKAYRVQHNNLLGPYKGGIRFHPQVSLDEVRALALLMSLKTAAVGLPLGGGKGGVAVDPRTLTDEELEQLSRAYVKHLHAHIGPKKDVPAPDVYTNPKIIDWMADEYAQITGNDSRAAFTGKSIEKGGSQGRQQATGRGGVLVLREVLKFLGQENKELTYAIQGFGNVGLFFATAAQELLPNLQLAAVTDSSGGVSSAFGLGVSKLAGYKQAGNKLINYEAGDVVQITNDSLLSEEVDVLVLAALGDVVNKSNASRIKAKIILELANGPVSEQAHQQLIKQGKVIVPDILANSGGVIVSYLEMLQNQTGQSWDEAEVNRHMEKILQPSIESIIKYAKANKLSLKEAALARAMSSIIKARQ